MKAPITTVMSATMIIGRGHGMHSITWLLGIGPRERRIIVLKLLTESHTPKQAEYFTRTGRQGSPVALPVRHTRPPE